MRYQIFKILVSFLYRAWKHEREVKKKIKQLEYSISPESAFLRSAIQEAREEKSIVIRTKCGEYLTQLFAKSEK